MSMPDGVQEEAVAAMQALKLVQGVPDEILLVRRDGILVITAWTSYRLRAVLRLSIECVYGVNVLFNLNRRT
jgi:hypothetical protein